MKNDIQPALQQNHVSGSTELELLKPGDLVDIYSTILEEWQLAYGRLEYQEPNGDWVYTITKMAHDGCYWSYGAKRENVRLHVR